MTWLAVSQYLMTLTCLGVIFVGADTLLGMPHGTRQFRSNSRTQCTAFSVQQNTALNERY